MTGARRLIDVGIAEFHLRPPFLCLAGGLVLRLFGLPLAILIGDEGVFQQGPKDERLAG